MDAETRKTLEGWAEYPALNAAIRAALAEVDALTQQVADLSGALVTIEERLRLDAAPLVELANADGTSRMRNAWKAVYSSAVHAQCFIVPALSAAKEAP